MSSSAVVPDRPSDPADPAGEGASARPRPGSRSATARRQTGLDLFALLFPEAFEEPASREPASVSSSAPRSGDRSSTEGRQAAAPPVRVAARALVAVMVCDGVLHPAERAFVDDLLVRRGQEPLEEEEIRPWRPSELPTPQRPEEVVEALASLAHIDGQRDPAEWRLVGEIAGAWGVERAFLEELEQSFTPSPRGAFRRLLAGTRRWIENPSGGGSERRS